MVTFVAKAMLGWFQIYASLMLLYIHAFNVLRTEAAIGTNLGNLLDSTGFVRVMLYITTAKRKP